MRIVLRGVAHGLSAIEREANLIGSLKLPSNAKGRKAERDRFENTLASSFIAGADQKPETDCRAAGKSKRHERGETKIAGKTRPTQTGAACRE